MTSSSTIGRWGRAALGLVAAALLSGCIGLPQDGPVVEAEVAGEASEDRASSIDALPPQPGASRIEIAKGFIEAMEAWPISTNVAKQYLTDDAAEGWTPDSTIIYSRMAPAREDGSTVSLRMRDAVRLDDSGTWRGPVEESRSTLDFQLTVEDGEFRILDPVDALVVRTTWFQERYRQASLFYFDPTAQVLVPEPVFVPEGETFTTNLVSALLAGHPARLRGVVRSFVPQGLQVGLSVPVVDGIAVLDLQGEGEDIRGAEAELMLAQLAATLAQEPSITALQVTIGGEPVDPPGGAATYDVGSADEFDPADTGSSGVLYGLRRGRVVSGSVDDLRVVDGPLGRGRRELASVAVAPVGDRVAAVSQDGREVLVGLLRSPAGQGRVRTLVSDGTEITQPSWDSSGRLWVLDRTTTGARVLVSDEAIEAREVRVPGISGTDARRILVSRDGTRLVTLVSRPGGDQLVASRIVLDDFGRVARVVESTVIRRLPGPRVVDVAWTGAAQIAVLTPASPGGLFEVTTVAVDGATVGVDILSTTVIGRVTGLAGEPYADTPVYAVLRDELFDVRTGDRLPTTPVRGLDYAG